jgi:hypothetical protein
MKESSDQENFTNYTYLRNQNEYIRNRKSDLNDFEYEKDFRQQTNLTEIEQDKKLSNLSKIFSI